MIGASEPRLRSLEKSLIKNASHAIELIDIERLKRDVIKFLGPHERIHTLEAMLRAE